MDEEACAALTFRKVPGLAYYRARYYHPTLHRFISEDPIGFGGGINFYVYAYNRPTTLRDPLGLFTTVVYYPYGADLIGHVGIGINSENTVSFRV